jgi:hypothetical protein
MNALDHGAALPEPAGPATPSASGRTGAERLLHEESNR